MAKITQGGNVPLRKRKTFQAILYDVSGNSNIGSMSFAMTNTSIAEHRIEMIGVIDRNGPLLENLSLFRDLSDPVKQKLMVN